MTVNEQSTPTNYLQKTKNIPMNSHNPNPNPNPNPNSNPNRASHKHTSTNTSTNTPTKSVVQSIKQYTSHYNTHTNTSPQIPQFHKSITSHQIENKPSSLPLTNSNILKNIYFPKKKKRKGVFSKLKRFFKFKKTKKIR